MSNWEDKVECSIFCPIHRSQFRREVADSVEIFLPLNPLEKELRNNVLRYKRSSRVPSDKGTSSDERPDDRLPFCKFPKRLRAI